LVESKDFAVAQAVATPEPERPFWQHKKVLRYAILVVALVIALAVGIYVGLSGNTTTSMSLAPSTAPNSAPTIPPIADSILAFRNSLPSYSLASILTDPTSPQAKALDWLAEDPLIETYDTERALQRFAMATFYYATTLSVEIGESVMAG
jgi:hypothetical protein